MRNWRVDYFITQSIHRCNVGGWQVTFFLFISEWFSLDAFGETTTWITSICFGETATWITPICSTVCCLHKVDYTSSSRTISKCRYFLIGHVLQQQTLNYFHMIYQFLSWSSNQFLSQKSRNWTPAINKNNMYVVPFSFGCIHSSLSMFLYGLDSFKVSFLSLFFHIKLLILPQIIPRRTPNLHPLFSSLK